MGTLKIIIRKEALSFIDEVALWYQFEMGKRAAQHFIDGVWNTINTLAQMPTIGVLDERRSTEKKKYYSFLSHPRYRVIYRYTKTRLYIVAIQATMMK